MRGIDLNTKKSFLAILEFSILKGKTAKFRGKKQQIFERYLPLNPFNIVKFNMKDET